MRPNLKLDKKLCPKTDQEIAQMSLVPYASAIGSIMYAMLCARPDVAYALSVTSRFQSNPGEEHWVAVKNILKYLKRTKDLFLVFGGEDELKFMVIRMRVSKQTQILFTHNRECCSR